MLDKALELLRMVDATDMRASEQIQQIEQGRCAALLIVIVVIRVGLVSVTGTVGVERLVSVMRTAGRHLTCRLIGSETPDDIGIVRVHIDILIRIQDRIHILR